MNKMLDIDETGVHYTVFEPEYDILSLVAEEKYGAPIDMLTIGKAARILNVIAFDAATKQFDSVVDADGNVVASKADDGSEATNAIIRRRFQSTVKESLLSVGRLTIDVVSLEDEGFLDALPTCSITILGSASLKPVA